MRIGIVHPGEMGAAVGAVLTGAGQTVVCALDDRSSETVVRAGRSKLVDVGTLAEVAAQSDVVLSICPPHAAREVARAFGGFPGIYVDANAVSRATADDIAAGMGRFVDGGIIGPPPTEPGLTRLYLSGAEATTVAALFEGTSLEAHVILDEPGAASALKMAYAAWAKGTIALLLACRELARAEGVEGDLIREWRRSRPDLEDRSAAAARQAAAKGWRWVGEMEEIASSFAAAGLPDGFHLAAAELFRTFPQPNQP